MLFNAFAILVAFASILVVQAARVQRNDCQDPLSCYLNSIEIDIPDSCQDVMGTDLCIENFSCYGIYLTAIPSEYEPPTTLNVGAVGLGTYCEGDYSYGRLVKGSATALINATDFDVGFFVGKEGELPVSTSFSHCNLTSIDVKISFSSKVLDGIAPALEELIKDGVDTLLCTDIPNFLEVNVTQALVTNVDPALEQLIHSQPSPLPVYNSHYTAWGDSIISKIKKIVDMIDGVADLKDFLLCFLQPSNAGAIKSAMMQEIQSLFLTQPGDAASSSSDGEVWDSFETDAGSYRVGIPADTVIFEKANFPPGYNSTVTLASVKVRGLDTVDELDILDPIEKSNVTLRTVVGFSNITIELGVEVDVVPTGEDQSSSTRGKWQVRGRERYTERLKVTLRMTEVSFLMDLVLAVNAFVLKSYYLDQLSTRSCWLSAVDQISIANLQLHTTINTLESVQVAGSAGELEADVIALVNNAVLLLISPEGFGQLTTDLINGLMQGPLRNDFNARAAAQLATAKADAPCLTHYPYNDHPDYIVWANSSIVNTVDFVVNDLLGYQGINKLMTCATNGTGELALNTSRLQLSLGGLNSFYALKILSPLRYGNDDDVKPYELESLISLGFCPFIGSPSCNPLEVLLSFNPDTLSSEDTPSASPSKLTAAFAQAVSAFDLSLSMSNFSLYLNTEMKLDKDGLRDTQYSQLDTLGCVGQSFNAIAIEGVSLSVVDARLSIDDGEMQRNVTTLIDKVLSAITRSDKIEERNNQIAYDLSVAEETCASGGVAPNVVVTDEDSSKKTMDWQWELFILVVGCLSSLIMLLAAYNYFGKAGKNVCTPDFVFQKSEEESADMTLPTRLYYRWDCKNSLLFHLNVPLWLRVVIPLCILGNIAMFLNSNIVPDAVSVMVKLVIGTKTIDVGSVFDFGLKSTVVDMWKAGVYPLAVLIMFFSGAWPYVKLCSMMVAWVAPPKIVSIERRETILTVLDVLGKWSLIDFFVMILMLCAFYFNIYIGEEIAVNVTVLPKWGFYGFLLATMISLGLGHIILACHRLVVEPKVLPIPDEYSPKESLSSLVYEFELNDRDVMNITAASADDVDAADATPSAPPLEDTESVAPVAAVDGISTPVPMIAPNPIVHKLRGTTMLIKVTTAGKVFVVLAIITTALFVVGGTFLETMRFEFKGLVGLMLKDEADVDYSFVTVGTSIPEHSGVPNDFATRWLQTSLFLFGQAMPFALLLAMLTLWLVPLTLSSQRQMFVLAEVLNAWSALDVFCIAIAAALLEIQQFAAFIVGDSCDSINVILAEYMDPILDGDDKCFDVVAQLDKNSWVLFVAAALLIVVALPLLSICNSAIHLRLKLSEQASLLMHHISHGTANANVREALRTLSKEQQYSGDMFARDGHLARPLLPDGSEEEEEGDEADLKKIAHGDPRAPEFVSLAAAGIASAKEDNEVTNAEAGRESVAETFRKSSGSGSSPDEEEGGEEARSATEATAEKKDTWWSLMNMHNFRLSCLQLLSSARLVELSYIPTRVVDDNVLNSASDSLAFYQN